ncbi:MULTISPECIES: hypothetical protein [unclassified Mesorhizobium]|uniref:hypothetical protein n=2 Tax=Mesorhizobium TaxID=68287 RepID=UPI000FCA036E|nr:MULTISPECIES: hypothetical protein [unclassified Mesorhizobium]TGP22327.1 hypothetical protein EN874_019645 [Mesorhizobium sp. M1D.F.Ca.ET.231.01.1.1]TGP24703.1 hypothetical protein EN877_30550 [Mesorhizobium sp. M1D.F.Ca.ET.234.01.1.1]TGS37306.1 hypothetical protein EN827_30855 [Mesorhizobium sp. M1D.F.Ca.ET.184.01.1.1]TGS58106.1 hypothetical protein EN826_030830 [Mesorhizobium sp. M1D.F.Ca.ET.183.01.1.1]
MDDYHVGRLVACIDENWQYNMPGEEPEGMTLPRKGGVYRIRSRVFLGSVLFLRFEEICNPEQPSPTGPFEPVFDNRSFMPLDDKRLDIFRQHFAPIVRRVDGVPA